MRLMVIAALLLASGCNQQANTSAISSAPSIVDSSEDDLTDGPFDAADNATNASTGDITAITKTQILFANGLQLTATHVANAHAFDNRNSGGDTYDDAAPGDNQRLVDVRQVTDRQFLGQDSGPELCGAIAPTYIALVHDEPMLNVAVIAFSGKDPPVDGAQDSTICTVLTFVLNSTPASIEPPSDTP
ncbi:MAG: hypothetical protein WDN76_00415 [Alphaproteobacteria bacterium]